MNQTRTLYDELTEYGSSDAYPFHMPGHKRSAGEEIKPFFREYQKRDITEIDDWDNLYHAEGRLKAAMERAAQLYHSERTFYLVNGSTTGVLTSILSSVSYGGSLIMMRASHRSAYHALLLGNIRGIYLTSKMDPETGLDLGVTAKDILHAVLEHPEASAVFLTSPTYEGFSLPLRQIAEELHRQNKILIVDAAHGAHFGMSEYLPENAVDAGADLVIHSIHKTLPSPTQTALLHINGSRVDPAVVERYFSVFQTSSPSYVLMAGIDECIVMMQKYGKTLWEEFYKNRRRLSEELSELRNIRIVDAFSPLQSEIDGTKEYFPDLCKMLLIPNRQLMTASELYHILHFEYHLQPEMKAPGYVLLILSVMDTREGYRRLRDALLEIDASIERQGKKKNIPLKKCETEAINPEKREDTKNNRGKLFGNMETVLPDAVYTIAEAGRKEREWVKADHAVGRISGEFVMAYPPGQPLLTPGERIDSVFIKTMEHFRTYGCELLGIKKEEGTEDGVWLLCLKNSSDTKTSEE